MVKVKKSVKISSLTQYKSNRGYGNNYGGGYPLTFYGGQAIVEINATNSKLFNPGVFPLKIFFELIHKKNSIQGLTF